MLELKKFDLGLRTTALALLFVFIPFAVIGLHSEGNDYAIFPFAAIVVLIVLELYIKIFLKPVSASFKDSEIIVKYYTGNTKKVHLEDIKGYSLTEEWTRYGKRKGVLLYLKDGKHLDFSEINIKDVLPITTYLIMKKVFNCGFETVKPWFFRKYKYDSLFVD